MSTNPVAGKYTQAQITYLGNYLSSLVTKAGLGTLSPTVAQAWITQEQGQNGNVLGVTYNDSSGQHLYAYSNPEAGLQAAVSNLQTNPAYTNVRAALKNGVSDQVVAAAINYSWPGSQGYSSGPLVNIVGGLKAGDIYPSIIGLHQQTAAQGEANVTGLPAAAASGVMNIITDIPSAIGFIGIILIGLAFIIGAFLLSKNDKSQVVVI